VGSDQIWRGPGTSAKARRRSPRQTSLHAPPGYRDVRIAANPIARTLRGPPRAACRAIFEAVQKPPEYVNTSVIAGCGGLQKMYSGLLFDAAGNEVRNPDPLTTIHGWPHFVNASSVGVIDATDNVVVQSNVGLNLYWLPAEQYIQPRSAWAKTGLVFTARESLRSSLADVRKTAVAFDSLLVNNWHDLAHVLQSRAFARFKRYVQPVPIASVAGPALGHQPLSCVFRTEVETLAAFLARVRAAVQREFRLFLASVGHAIVTALGNLSKSRVVLHMLERPQRLNEYVAKQRAWHLLHGARPPRGLALLNTLFNGSIYPLGVPA